MANILSFCYLRRSVVVRAALEDIKMFVAGRLNVDVQHCGSRRRHCCLLLFLSRPPVAFGKIWDCDSI